MPGQKSALQSSRIHRLKDKSDWFMRRGKVGKSPVRADRAIQTLRLFAESVRKDAGIGVSEFDNAPCTAHSKDFRYERQRRAPNYQVKEAICEKYGVDALRYRHARRLLCKATAYTTRKQGIY